MGSALVPWVVEDLEVVEGFERTFAPLVVLVINNNIYLIELMFPLSIFQEKLNDRDGKRIVEIPQDARK